MSLTYHFSFGAAEHVPADELERFLRNVEREAVEMGFDPTTVMSGPFDSPERRDFSRRVARGIPLEDDRLKQIALPAEKLWGHNPETGLCRVAPEQGVALIITDREGRETVLGFFRYPHVVRDCDGRDVMPVPGAGAWTSGAFVVSPDPRYRRLVRMFAEAGYLASEHDEYLTTSRK